MKAAYDWVIVRSGDLRIVCLRCGKTCKPDLPMEIDVYCAMTKAFLKVHKKCRNRGETTNAEPAADRG